MTNAKKTRKRTRTDIRMEHDHNVIVATFKHDDEVVFEHEELDEYLTMYSVTRKRAFLSSRRNKLYFSMIKQNNVYWFMLDVTCQEEPDDNEYIRLEDVEQMLGLIKYILWTRE